MTRARDIANFGDGIATADIGDGQITTAKIASGAITDALLPTGSVLQVVTVNYGTEASTTGTSLVDTGLSASITPSSASSKVLILLSQNLASQGDNGVRITIAKNGTTLVTLSEKTGFTFDSGWNYVGTTSFSYLDSPATTSAVTYKTQFRSSSSGVTAVTQVDNDDSSMTLMEIAG